MWMQVVNTYANQVIAQMYFMTELFTPLCFPLAFKCFLCGLLHVDTETCDLVYFFHIGKKNVVFNSFILL